MVTPRVLSDRSLAPLTHSSAEVSASARIGANVQVWHQAQIREGAVVGDGCIIGKGAYIDSGVVLGRNCKIQNYALVYRGSVLGNGVFVGPAAILTNDRYPRAITPWGDLKGVEDWECGRLEIADGASVGAGAVLITGIHVGRFAMIGADSVVTHDVPAHALMIGTPAWLAGWVCRCGRPLVPEEACVHCGDRLEEVRS